MAALPSLTNKPTERPQGPHLPETDRDGDPDTGTDGDRDRDGDGDRDTTGLKMNSSSRPMATFHLYVISLIIIT